MDEINRAFYGDDALDRDDFGIRSLVPQEVLESIREEIKDEEE